MRDRLLIKKIEISNVGGFVGDHTIELSSESAKNFTIVIGLSGRGKSTLFQLIHWCLYGIHYEPHDESSATHEGIINLPQLESLNEGEKVSGKISLRINDQNGEKYVLERMITAEKLREESRTKFDLNNNSKIDSGIQTEVNCKLKMKDKHGNDVWEKNETLIDAEIRKHLPHSLRDFFLFDGENLTRFRTKTGSSELIRDGIEKISGLTVLDSLIEDVDYTFEKISNSLVGKSVSSKGLGKTVQTLKDEIKELNDTKQGLVSDLSKKEASLNEIVQQIASSSEGKRIEDQITGEENNLKRISKSQKTNERETHEFLYKKLPIMLLSNTLRQSENSFAVLEKMNLIPPSITREALDKIFKENLCICGRDFEENDSVWKKLHEIKKAVLDKDTTSGITAGRTLISQMRDEAILDDVKQKFSELQNTSADLDKEKIESQRKQEQLFEEQQKIKGGHGLNYDELVDHRKELLSDIAGLRADINSINDDLIEKEDKLEENNKKYKQKLVYEGEHEKDLAKQSILQAILKFSKKKRKTILETLQIETEKATGKYFKNCAPQAYEFAALPPEGPGPVRIGSNYDISGINPDGKEKQLSKGQAHALGLSYVSGCRQITSSDTFLFIDSPLHNISGDSRNEAAQVLSKHLPDVQIVLFVTDSEYLSGDDKGAKAVREYLNPQNKVWKEWIIHVTCTDCKGKRLYLQNDRKTLLCKNCNKKYDKQHDPTGPRMIMEYDGSV